MHIHPLITDYRIRSKSSANGSPAPTSSRSTPSSCARTPIGRTSACSRSPTARRRRRSTPRPRASTSRPLLNLLVNNEHVLKVFHAGGQDIEIVFNLTGGTPHPLFDTQIAAMALGLGEQVGYSNLVESLLGTNLDKGARFTDWARRPLDKRQIDYAIGDVTHLAELFPKMLERLKRDRPRRMARPGDGADRRPGQLRQRSRARLEAGQDPEPQARRARPAQGARRLARDRGAGQEPAARPDHEGRDAGRRRHATRPASQEALGKVRGLSPAWKDNDIGARMMEALANAEPLPAAELPPREERGPGPRQGRRAGRRPAQAAAQDPGAREQCRAAAGRPLGGAGAARRRPARGPARSSKAGASRSSAATRSTWSRAGSPSRSGRQAGDDPHRDPAQ